MATATVPRLGPVDHGRRMSIDEFEAADAEEGFRYELGKGVLEVTQIPGTPHACIYYLFFKLLILHDLQHPGIIARCGGPTEFRLCLPGMESVRPPDLAAIIRGAGPGPRRH